MFTSADGGSEEPVVAAVGHVKPFSQLLGAHGEVAHGDVGSVDAFQCLSQLLLVGGGGAEDVQLASWEIGQVSVGYEEMAVGRESADGKAL